MHMNSNGFFILITCLLSIGCTPSWAVQNPAPVTIDAQESQDVFFLCKNIKSTRWLRAYRLDSGKCMTTYSKEGYLQVISSATYFALCEAVLHNVRKNIEEGGYKCNRLATYSYIDIE